MLYRPLRIPVWLVVIGVFVTFVIGSNAGPAVLPDIRPGFQIVTPNVGDVITQDVTPEIAQTLHMNRAEGVLVSDVSDNPLRPGDVILAINGNAVACQKELDAQLAQVNFGETFSVEVLRHGRIQTVTVQRAPQTPLIPTVLQGTSEIRGISVAGLSTENGVIVTDVRIGTPASDLGLRSGDLILDVNGHPVHTVNEFVEFMRQLNNRPAIFNVRHTNGHVDVFVISA
jgi:serine protease Do